MLVSSASSIEISVSSDAGSFTEVIDADSDDRVYGSTTIGSDHISHSITGSARLKERHSVSNTKGATAEVGVDIRGAEWYSYNYDLWPGQGSSWKAKKYPEVSASEDLDVTNASYIEAYASASSPKGYSAGVSAIVSEPERKGSLTGYHNLAVASMNEVSANQTADLASSPNGYVRTEARVDLGHLRSRPLSFRGDTAEASLRVDSGSIEGYSDLARSSVEGVEASQHLDSATGKKMQIKSEASSRTASIFKSLKTDKAKVSTCAEGSLTGYNARASVSDGAVWTEQTGQIMGTYASTASTSDDSRKTRTSNYGSTYDLDIQARKDKSGSYAIGALGYYVNIADPVANRIQGAVDASESGDTINVAPGTYRENVQIDKSLDILGAGAGETIVDGNRSGSVFTMGRNDPNVDVALADMTILRGSGTAAEISPGNTYTVGGGVLNYGKLMLKDIILSNNSAQQGGGIANLNATLDLNGESMISDNFAHNIGGGIYSHCSKVTLNDKSSISRNYAERRGGGVSSTMYSSLVLNDNSSISKNRAGWEGGAGVSSGENGTVILNDYSYISNNIAVDFRFGIGGGIYSFNNSLVNLNGHSHISSNTASKGGGIYNPLTSIVSLNDSSYISDNSGIVSGGTGSYGSGMGAGIFNEGVVNVEGGNITGNYGKSGGGIYNRGTVNLNRSNIAGNSVSSRIGAGGGSGGGIYNEGTVNLDGGSIAGNYADLSGGGIANHRNGTVNLIGVNIIGNRAESGGAGITNSGTVNMKGGSIAGNTRPIRGGGIGNDGTLNLIGVNITGNRGAFGGGISNGGTVNLDRGNITGNQGTYGGGIVNFDTGIVNLMGVNITGNHASWGGGGILNILDEDGNSGNIVGRVELVRDNKPDDILISIV